MNAAHEALRAASLGIPTLATCWPEDGRCAVHDETCTNPGKRPIGRKVDATIDPAIIRRRHARYPRAGLKWIPVEEYGVLDVDAKSGGLESTTRMMLEHGPLRITWADSNGSDAGGHYALRVPGGFDGVLILAPGVEAFGRGSQITMPPSPHYLGGRRTWRPGCSPDDVPLADAPLWLVKRIRTAEARGERRSRRRRGEPLSPAEVAQFADLFGSVGVEARGRSRGVYRCPFHGDRNPSLSVDWRRGLFKCWAASCDAQGSIGTLRRLLVDAPRAEVVA